jgi:hypothetical protein
MRKPLFFLVLFACAASAQEAPPDNSTRGQAPGEPDAQLRRKWEQKFRAADQDGSRSLDRAEAQAGLPKVLFKNFDKIDTDASGAITPKELWAMHEREVAAREQRRAARVRPPI